MTTEITKQPNANYVARYNTGAQDPYAAFANESGPGIRGKLLTCKKGEWSLGQDATPVPPTTQFLIVVSEMLRGWMKWEAGAVVGADVGLVRENFPVKHRYALGDMDEEKWEKDPTGKPRDPWSRSYHVLLIEVSPPHGDITYAGGSYGTALALKEICRIYSTEGPLHPDCFPVVTLTTKTRAHKAYGNIRGPWFAVVGWATVADVKAGKKSGNSSSKSPRAKVKVAGKVELAGAQPIAGKTTGAEINDELPDWDQIGRVPGEA